MYASTHERRKQASKVYSTVKPQDRHINIVVELIGEDSPMSIKAAPLNKSPQDLVRALSKCNTQPFDNKIHLCMWEEVILHG